MTTTGPPRTVHRTDVRLDIDRGPAPGAVAAGGRGLAELVVWNVLINLKDITDQEFVGAMRDKCESLLQDARTLLEQLTTHVDTRLAELIEGKN